MRRATWNFYSGYAIIAFHQITINLVASQIYWFSAIFLKIKIIITSGTYNGKVGRRRGGVVGYNPPSRMTCWSYDVEKPPWGLYHTTKSRRGQSAVSTDRVWFMARNPLSGEADLSIYSYVFCVKGVWLHYIHQWYGFCR